MTKCSKEVQEVEFKLFLCYLDAVLNEKYFLEKIDVEGGSPPDQIQSKTLKEEFRLKNFTRRNENGSFIEQIYLKIS